MIKDRFSGKLKEMLSSDEWMILQPEYDLYAGACCPS